MNRYIIAIIILIVGITIFIFSGRNITVSSVPFGLEAGEKIRVGEKADFPSMSQLVELDVQRANDLRIAGVYGAAHDYYETILLKNPNLPAALFGAAYSILASDTVSEESVAKAKILTENLSKQLGESVWVKLLSTFFLEKEGNLNYAQDMAAELVEESPAFAEARLRYANLMLKNGQAEKALNEARSAISISGGTDARTYVSLAFALHKMNDLEECAELVNYAMPRFPSQTDLLLLHGYLSEYNGDFDSAQNDYKKILALKPNDVKAIEAIATLGEKTPGGIVSLKEQIKETAKIILPLVEEYPENLPLREALGRIYLKARLLKEAREQFSEIYAQDFEYPGIRMLMEESSEEQQRKFISPPMPMKNSQELADSLAKTFAAMRESQNFDYDELGRYFVHYGVGFKEFFSKYSVTRFKKHKDALTFTEKYNLNFFEYENTVYFDSKKKFYAVLSDIKYSGDKNSYDYIQDLYGHFLKKETGILGEGSVAETAQCWGDDRWNGVIWVSRDNFEILMQAEKNPYRVYILRLNAKLFPDTGNICSYANMAMGRFRVPKYIPFATIDLTSVSKSSASTDTPTVDAPAIIDILESDNATPN